MVQQASRAFSGGGPKIPAIDSKITDFDVVVVGKSSVQCGPSHSMPEQCTESDSQATSIINKRFRWPQLDNSYEELARERSH